MKVNGLKSEEKKELIFSSRPVIIGIGNPASCFLIQHEQWKKLLNAFIYFPISFTQLRVQIK